MFLWCIYGVHYFVYPHVISLNHAFFISHLFWACLTHFSGRGLDYDYSYIQLIFMELNRESFLLYIHNQIFTQCLKQFYTIQNDFFFVFCINKIYLKYYFLCNNVNIFNLIKSNILSSFDSFVTINLYFYINKNLESEMKHN